jgi:hypothetical protein
VEVWLYRFSFPTDIFSRFPAVRSITQICDLSQELSPNQKQYLPTRLSFAMLTRLLRALSSTHRGNSAEPERRGVAEPSKLNL